MKLLDVVSLIEARPDLGLKAGERGTIVEDFGDDVLVEFSDDDGQQYAMPVLGRAELALSWEAPPSRVSEVLELARRKVG